MSNLKALRANVAASVAAFSLASDTIGASQNDVSVAMVRLSVEGKQPIAPILEKAKEAYGYAAKDSKARDLWRQTASRTTTIVEGWADVSAEDRAAFLAGDLKAYKLAQSIKAPHNAAKAALAKADREEEAKRAEQKLRADAREAFGLGELALILAKRLDRLEDAGSLSKAEAKALGALFGSVAAFKARVSEAATAPAAPLQLAA